MAENLVNKYIEITKKQIIQYLKNVFDNKIKKRYSRKFYRKIYKYKILQFL